MTTEKPIKQRGRPATGQAKPRTAVAVDYRQKKVEQGLAWLATWIPAPLAAQLKAKAAEENLTIGHIIERYLKLPEENSKT